MVIADIYARDTYEIAPLQLTIKDIRSIIRSSKTRIEPNRKRMKTERGKKTNKNQKVNGDVVVLGH